MSLWYKLDENKNVVPCSAEEFNLQMMKPEEYRRVGRTQIGPYVVSTVFLVIDHGFGGSQHLWFETMIWSEKTEGYRFFSYQVRYETYREALAGHVAVVKLVEEGILP